MMKSMWIVFIIFFIWCLIGFVGVLWGLHGKTADILFGEDDDVIAGIIFGPLGLLTVIIYKLPEVKIRDILYKLVNKKVDGNDS